MATFGGLYDFPDLSDGQSELSSPPDSSDSDESDEATEDEEDAWYNIPSDSEDEDDDSIAPSFTLLLPLCPPSTSIAFTIPDIIRKEHSTGARIKAIYMLK
jgi:hypothetical protein